MYPPAPPKSIQTLVRSAPSRGTIPSSSRPALRARAALASGRHLYGTDAGAEGRGLCPCDGLLALEPGCVPLSCSDGWSGRGTDATPRNCVLTWEAGGGDHLKFGKSRFRKGRAHRGGRRAGPESKLGVLDPRGGHCPVSPGSSRSPGTVFWLCRAF